MRQKEHFWWISASVLSLAAFSFFAGLGLRGLYKSLNGSEQASNLPPDYTQIASAQPRLPGRDTRTPQFLYADVMRKLELYYVEPLPPKTEQAYGSIDYMLNELKDPNTRLLSPVEMKALESGAAGEFPGLGAVLTIRRYDARQAEKRAAAAAQMAAEENDSPITGVRTVTVVSVIPGSPAEKAGLLPGDRITEFDGHWIAPAHVSYRVLTQLTDPLGPQDGRPLDPDEELPKPMGTEAEREAARKEADEARSRWKTSTDLPTTLQALYGAMKGEHTLTVDRGTPSKSQKVTVNLSGARADLFSAKTLNPSTGYVRILAVTDGTPKLLAESLSDFRSKGVKSLVIDLRSSAGGTLSAAAETAGLLMPGARLAILKEKGPQGKPVDRPVTARPGATEFKPAAVSVLVDGGTAGVSELLAAALRENLGAKLVGTQTFGDGTYQDVIRLENGAGISITRAKMVTSKGAAFDNVGLKPDTAPQGDAVQAGVKALASSPASAKGSGS